ncbi:MAG: hypothetical protein KKF41_04385 [Actinobacteria bacterium]|nr:hypothetical protein [Actinomycetota bacterium]MBU1943448.1 hypothetical protein [Actinomycetota bacterium]MBU2686805.1 hypothetical protein [Actinomycetota bacterium]
MGSLQARNVIAFLSFAATALNIALAAYVLYKNPRRAENVLFALMALALAVWAFGDAMYNVSDSFGARAFWVRFQAPGEILFPVLFGHLALVFTRALGGLREWVRHLLEVSLYLPALFALVSFYSTEWVFHFRSAAGTGALTTRGWLYWGYAFFSYALLLGALALYIRDYYHSRRLREKRIAQVMVLAVAVPLVVNVLENARLYRLSSTPCFFTLAAAAFAYGILRLQMFSEVEQVLKRSIVYFVLAVLISTAYVLTIVIAERFISSYFSARGYMVTALFILLLVLVFEPLRGLVMKGVDRLFYRRDYEVGRVLSTLARSLAELSGLDQITRRITETLTGTMGLTGAALLYEPAGDGEWMKSTVSGFGADAGETPGLALEGSDLTVERTGGRRESYPVLEIPLVFERERVGTLLLGDKLSGLDLSFNDRALLSAMAPQMAVALENGALFEEVLARQERVNELMERLAAAHEEERRRIARELHDGVAQSFLGVVYLSEFTLDGLERDLAAAKADLQRLRDRARAGLEELRAVIDDLRPIPLEVLGLAGAARKLVGEIAAEGRMGATLQTDLDEGERLPPLVEGNCYRILQEALNNARKHSGARNVTVRLLWDGPRLVMSVTDDGAGMPGPGSVEGGGLGMSSMRERAGEMGGELIVRSEVKGGTTVEVVVPLTGGGDA